MPTVLNRTTLKTMTKQDFLTFIEDALVRSGVGHAVAARYAREYLSDLEHGQHLAFADVGEIEIHDDRAIIRDLPVSSRAVRSAAFSSAQAPRPERVLPTLELETSIRELVKGGYTRPYAESALMSLQGK